MSTLAVDIGGTKFTLGAFDGQILVARESRPTDRSGGPGAMLRSIRDIYTRWVRELGFHPSRCGIGFGGPIDFSTQTVTQSTHVGGWDNYPLVSEIARLTDAPTIMDNDANVGALGEAFYGAARHTFSSFYITLSTGIGGGIIVNRSLYRGIDSFAGEIGHMNVVPDGPDCLCGSRGCFERMCCGLWLERDYGRPARELLLDADFTRNYVIHLARGLKAALMILNPEVVVIGGGISKAGDLLFAPLREELERQMPAWSRARRNVIPAQLGDDSVLYGAQVLAAEASVPS